MHWLIIVVPLFATVAAVIAFLIHTRRLSADDLKHAPFIVHLEAEKPTDYPAKSLDQAVALQHMLQAAHGPQATVTIRETNN